MLMFFMTAGLSLTLFTENPLLLVFILLVLVLSVSGSVGLVYSTWFAYVLMLVYVGGMMVLFMYMVSLVYSTKVQVRSYGPGGFLLLLIFVMGSTSPRAFGLSTEISSFYFYSNSSIVIMLGGYLLLVLTVVVKLVMSWKGSMKCYF